MLDDFEAAKKELSAIRARAKTLSEPFLQIGQSFDKAYFNEAGALDESIAALPSKEDLRELVNDARRTMRTMREIAALLAESGIKIE